MDTDGVEYVKSALDPLCGSLQDLLSKAAAGAQQFRVEQGLTEPEYNSMGADVTRALAHKALSGRADFEDWRVGGRHHLRGQLLLRNNVMRLRFLHDRAGAVPAPGTNVARRAYYRNVPFGQQRLLDAETSSLIAVWRVVDPKLSLVAIRVVRPISDTGRWSGASTEVDLDFVLPDLNRDLYNLEFEQVDEGLNLEMPDRDEDEDAGLEFQQRDDGLNLPDEDTPDASGDDDA